MDQMWYYVGAAVVIVMMCVGIYGMAIAKKGRRRQGR